ncbi:MAG TPA: DNA alkylation repair protein [Chryseosolibacter sp.]|nr:DNA alkylation repair protein [Chryseosolibacter sp.]
MKNVFHSEILQQIRALAGKKALDTFLDSYLGNTHPRYDISAPTLRKIAREWTRSHRDLDAAAFANVLTSLIHGESSTEKWIAGMLLDFSTREQREFDPRLFDEWLDHLVGWAEVDAVCSNSYTKTHIPARFKEWKKLLTKFSKDKNVHKRRAALVALCAPVRYSDDDDLADLAFENIDRLRSEKEVLITKAISWLLRSMIKLHRPRVVEYINANREKLPAIAVRETLVKLKTGTKTKRKKTAG